jgi:hypothetical protein
MKRINTLVLGIITASLTGLPLISAQATITDPNWVLDRVIINQRGGSSPRAGVIGLKPNGTVDWENKDYVGGPYGHGFSAAVLHNDRLYVSVVEYPHQVREYNPNTGADLGALIHNQNLINQPADLTFGSDGALYVANQSPTFRVSRFDANGAVLGVPFNIGDLADTVNGAVLGDDGILYVNRAMNPPAIVTYQGPAMASPGTNIGFSGFPHDGSELPKYSGFPRFWQGSLYVNGSDGIYKLSADLSVATKWTSDDGAYQGTGIYSRQFEFGLDGFVYQAFSNGNVLRYDNESGAFSSVFSEGHENLAGLALQSHVIPEPATALLIGVGMLMLSAMRRRMR